MTMTGVIITVVASGFVSLFISHTFLRKRMGLGMAIMFFLPAASCAIYVLLTSSRFNPPVQKEPEKAIQRIVKNEEIATPLPKADIGVLEQNLEENPDDLDSVIALANGYMSWERYDEAISLLKNRSLRFPDQKLVVQLTTAHFAKGLLFAEQGKFKQALYSLRAARKIAPEEAPFLQDLDNFIMMAEEQVAAEEAPENVAPQAGEASLPEGSP